MMYQWIVVMVLLAVAVIVAVPVAVSAVDEDANCWPLAVLLAVMVVIATIFLACGIEEIVNPPIEVELKLKKIGGPAEAPTP